MKNPGFSFSPQHFKKNLPLLISATAADCLLLLFPTIPSILISILLVGLFCWLAGMREYAMPRARSGIRQLAVFAVAGMLSVAGLCRLYWSWSPSGRLAALVGCLGLSADTFLILAGILGVIVGFYAVLLLSSVVIVYLCPKVCLAPGEENPVLDAEKHSGKLSARELLFILATAILTISICSKSSPLYPFNDWVDSNAFLTVGKSMLHGLVPYRDLFEQKGLLLYVIHMLAALLSETSFIGVYLWEILACAVFLLLSLKLMRLYRRDCPVVLLAAEAVIVYTASCFCFGDSAEEFCLPLIAYGLYVGLKSICFQRDISGKEAFLIGVTSACVLWIKYTMLGFYLGWIVVPAFLLIRKKRIAGLIQFGLWILAGVMVVTLPILVYLLRNNALDDMWTVYFYDNIFYYAQTEGMTSGLFHAIFSRIQILIYGLMSSCSNNLLTILCILVAVCALAGERARADMVFYLFSFMGVFITVYVGGTAYKYYSLIFSAFVPLGLLAVAYVLVTEKKVPLLTASLSRWKQGLVWGCCICLMMVTSPNRYLMFVDQSELPQFQFAEIIAQKEGATLLNYGFLDGGFYTVSGIVPSCKYFHQTNLVIEEMLEVQEQFIEEGLVDFVVTQFLILDAEHYECVAEASYYLDGTYPAYYLYQLVE